MSNTVNLVARPHPFSQRPAMCEVPAGRTISRILADIVGDLPMAATIRVDIGGHEVPHQLWNRVKPKAGTHIHATVMPAGGDGNKWLRAILMVVVLIVAWYAAPLVAGVYGAAAGAVASAAITMLGALANSVLVPNRNSGT